MQGVPRLRHVSVESGIRLIGAEAWQNCRQLRIVKLPATVVGIADNAFRDCKLLNSVLAPGCRDFGYKAFAECCSLQWVYASEGVANMFNSEAKFGQYLFQGCINLAEFTLSELPSPRGSTLQARTSELAPGCLSSTGITALALTKHFVAIGAHACDGCRLLKSVDLCNTDVEEIPEFTFVHCTSLREVLLPTTLHTILRSHFGSRAWPCVQTQVSLRGQPTEHLGIMAAARTAANALTSLVRQSPLVQDDQIYDPWLIQEVQDEYRALAQEALYWPLSAASHLAHLNEVCATTNATTAIQKHVAVRPGKEVLDLLLWASRESLLEKLRDAAAFHTTSLIVGPAPASTLKLIDELIMVASPTPKSVHVVICPRPSAVPVWRALSNSITAAFGPGWAQFQAMSDQIATMSAMNSTNPSFSNTFVFGNNVTVVVAFTSRGADSLDQDLDALNMGNPPYTLVLSDSGFEQFDADFPMLLAKHAAGAVVFAITYLPVPLLRMLVKAVDLAKTNYFESPFAAHAVMDQSDGATKLLVNLTYIDSDHRRDAELLKDRPSFLRLPRAHVVNRNGKLQNLKGYGLAYEISADATAGCFTDAGETFYVRPLLDMLHASAVGWTCAGREVIGASPVSFLEMRLANGMGVVADIRAASDDCFIAGYFLHSPSAAVFTAMQRKALETPVDMALFKKYMVQLGTNDGEKLKEALRTGRGWFELLESKVIAVDNRKSGINLGDSGAYVADLSLHSADRLAMTYGVARLTLANHSEALNSSADLVRDAIRKRMRAMRRLERQSAIERLSRDCGCFAPAQYLRDVLLRKEPHITDAWNGPHELRATRTELREYLLGDTFPVLNNGAGGGVAPGGNLPQTTSMLGDGFDMPSPTAPPMDVHELSMPAVVACRMQALREVIRTEVSKASTNLRALSLAQGQHIMVANDIAKQSAIMGNFASTSNDSMQQRADFDGVEQTRQQAITQHLLRRVTADRFSCSLRSLKCLAIGAGKNYVTLRRLSRVNGSLPAEFVELLHVRDMVFSNGNLPLDLASASERYSAGAFETLMTRWAETFEADGVRKFHALCIAILMLTDSSAVVRRYRRKAKYVISQASRMSAVAYQSYIKLMIAEMAGWLVHKGFLRVNRQGLMCCMQVVLLLVGAPSSATARHNSFAELGNVSDDRRGTMIASGKKHSEELCRMLLSLPSPSPKLLQLAREHLLEMIGLLQVATNAKQFWNCASTILRLSRYLGGDVIAGGDDQLLRTLRNKLVAAFERCPFLREVISATNQNEASSEVTLLRLGTPVSSLLPVDVAVSAKEADFDKLYSSRCRRKLDSLQDAGSYDFFMVHTLTWASSLTTRAVEALAVDGAAFCAKLELSGDANGRVLREAQFAHAPNFLLSDSPSGDCNLQVVKLMRRYAGLTTTTLDNLSIYDEIKQPGYKEGPLIVVSITSGDQTTVHFLGRGIGNSISALTKVPGANQFLHVAVLEGSAKAKNDREQAYLEAAQAANALRAEKKGDAKSKDLPHFIRPRDTLLERRGIVHHVTASLVLAARFQTQPEIQHGKLDVTIGPAYEDTARRAKAALEAAGLITSSDLLIGQSAKQQFHSAELQRKPQPALLRAIASEDAACGEQSELVTVAALQVLDSTEEVCKLFGANRRSAKLELDMQAPCVIITPDDESAMAAMSNLPASAKVNVLSYSSIQAQLLTYASASTTEAMQLFVDNAFTAPAIPDPANASASLLQQIASMSVHLDDVEAFQVLRGWHYTTSLPPRNHYLALANHAKIPMIVRHVTSCCLRFNRNMRHGRALYGGIAATAGTLFEALVAVFTWYVSEAVPNNVVFSSQRDAKNHHNTNAFGNTITSQLTTAIRGKLDDKVDAIENAATETTLITAIDTLLREFNFWDHGSSNFGSIAILRETAATRLIESYVAMHKKCVVWLDQRDSAQMLTPLPMRSWPTGPSNRSVLTKDGGLARHGRVIIFDEGFGDSNAKLNDADVTQLVEAFSKQGDNGSRAFSKISFPALRAMEGMILRGGLQVEPLLCAAGYAMVTADVEQPRGFDMYSRATVAELVTSWSPYMLRATATDVPLAAELFGAKATKITKSVEDHTDNLSERLMTLQNDVVSDNLTPAMCALTTLQNQSLQEIEDVDQSSAMCIDRVAAQARVEAASDRWDNAKEYTAARPFDDFVKEVMISYTSDPIFKHGHTSDSRPSTVEIVLTNEVQKYFKIQRNHWRGIATKNVVAQNPGVAAKDVTEAMMNDLTGEAAGSGKAAVGWGKVCQFVEKLRARATSSTQQIKIPLKFIFALGNAGSGKSTKVLENLPYILRNASGARDRNCQIKAQEEFLIVSPTRPLKFGHREAAFEQIVAVAEKTGLPRGNLQYFGASETKDKAVHYASQRPLKGIMYDEAPKGGLPDLLAIAIAQMSFRNDSTSYTEESIMEPLTVFALGDHEQVKHIEYSRDQQDDEDALLSGLAVRQGKRMRNLQQSSVVMEEQNDTMAANLRQLWHPDLLKGFVVFRADGTHRYARDLWDQCLSGIVQEPARFTNINKTKITFVQDQVNWTNWSREALNVFRDFHFVADRRPDIDAVQGLGLKCLFMSIGSADTTQGRTFAKYLYHANGDEMVKQLTPRTADFSDKGEKMHCHWLTAITRMKSSPNSHLIVLITGPSTSSNVMRSWMSKVGKEPPEVINFAELLARLKQDAPRPAGQQGDSFEAIAPESKVALSQSEMDTAVQYLLERLQTLETQGNMVDRSERLTKFALSISDLPMYNQLFNTARFATRHLTASQDTSLLREVHASHAHTREVSMLIAPTPNRNRLLPTLTEACLMYEMLLTMHRSGHLNVRVATAIANWCSNDGYVPAGRPVVEPCNLASHTYDRVYPEAHPGLRSGYAQVNDIVDSLPLEPVFPWVPTSVAQR